MSPAQLAIAVGANTKWIQNARRILGRAAAHDPAEARWLGLVHSLHNNLDCSLAAAANVADLAIAASSDQRYLGVEVGDDGRTKLVIDLWRDQTIFMSRLAQALTRPPVERRGRPSTQRSLREITLARAIEYGVDVSRLRAGLARTVSERLSRLDDDAAFLAAGRASLARRHAGS